MIDLTRQEIALIAATHLEANIWAAAYAAWLPHMLKENPHIPNAHDAAVEWADAAVHDFRKSFDVEDTHIFGAK